MSEMDVNDKVDVAKIIENTGCSSHFLVGVLKSYGGYFHASIQY